MILYQPIFDPYHCSYRLLNLLNYLNEKEVEIERLKIYDFILLYPSFLHKMTLPQSYTYIRKSIRVNDYNSISSEKITFAQLNKMQNISLNELSLTSIIEGKKLKKGLVKRTDLILPELIINSFMNQNEEKIKILNFMKYELNNLSIGKLKERTGLIEYRYDKI